MYRALNDSELGYISRHIHFAWSIRLWPTRYALVLVRPSRCGRSQCEMDNNIKHNQPAKAIAYDMPKPDGVINTKFDVLQKCCECGSAAWRVFVPFHYGSVFFGNFQAVRCDNNHTFLTEDSSRAVVDIAKAKGLWGTKFKSKLWVGKC